MVLAVISQVIVLHQVQAAALLEPSSGEATTISGERVYQQVCAMCHEAGVPKAPQRGMLGFMSTAAIYHSLTEGVMASRVPQLSDAEKQVVAEYLTGEPLLKESDLQFPMCKAGESAFDLSQPPSAKGWGVNPENTRRYLNSKITPKTIAGLKPKWVFGFPNAVRARSHPVVAAGAVFVGSQDGRVYSLDRESGCVRWIYRARAEVRTAIVMEDWDAGDRQAKPALFFGDYLGNVYALDARTGKLNWTLRPDSHANATITAAPTLYDGVLYVPISSLEVLAAIESSYPCCNFRGSIVALKAESGELLWQSYTILQTPVVQGKNVAGTDQYGPSGAPVWNTPAIDIKRNQLIFGTGENYSLPATGTSDAIIALDLKSGKTNWVFQATKNDAWNSACEVEDDANCPQPVGPDYDFGAATMLLSDQGKDYVIAGQKSGVVWALSPEDGGLLWQQEVSKGGINGGIHFGMAASEGRLFIPISDADAAKHHAPREPTPGLFALDLETGEYLWRWQAGKGECGPRPYCRVGNGAAITATDELVFSGSLDGHIRAHDITNGKVVWSFDTSIDFKAINGVKTRGGAMEGAAAAYIDGDMLFLNSGYFFNPYMPGNAFIAFELQP